jgi:L-cysteine/cystine lyase
MNSRRDFIKLGAMSTLAAILPKTAASAPTWPKQEDAQFWKALRDQFPLSKDFTYLNNGTMGPSPYPVLERFKKAIDDTNVFAAYGGGKEEALSALARMTGTHKDEIAITHNVTEGINIVCWGLKLKKRDEIIITDQEHVGNGLPWLHRALMHGLKLKVISPASTAEETLDRIRKAISKRTKVIAVPHIPCTTGQILPAKEICTLAREKGIFSFIDGAHGPGMLTLDLHDMGCDAYASCCHKWMLAPKGTGFLYVRKDKLDAVQAYHVGGYSSGAWNLLSHPPQLEGLVPTAHRYFYGTQSAALYHGIAASVEFHEKIGIKKIQDRIIYLGKYMQNSLLALGNEHVEMLTPTEEKSRGAVVAFRLRKVGFQEAVEKSRKAGFIIRGVPENNINCIRVSTHIYNSENEIDAFVQNIKSQL